LIPKLKRGRKDTILLIVTMEVKKVFRKSGVDSKNNLRRV